MACSTTTANLLHQVAHFKLLYSNFTIGRCETERDLIGAKASQLLKSRGLSMAEIEWNSPPLELHWKIWDFGRGWLGALHTVAEPEPWIFVIWLIPSN